MAEGPWNDFEAQAKPSGPWDDFHPTPSTSASQSALEHFGNAASLGYLPHLQAAAGQLMPNPNESLDRSLASRGFKINQAQPSYISDRDANIQRMQQEAEEHPNASLAGSVGGALVGAGAMSGLTPINAATRMGRVMQAAKGGALMGALSNPGDAQGVSDPYQVQSRLGNAAVGGALGGAGQGALEGASKMVSGVSRLPDALQGKAEERAFKSSGAMLKDYRQIAGQDRVNALGRYMIDNDLVKPGMTVADIGKAAETLQEQHGKNIGSILKQLDEAGSAAPTHEELAKAIEAQASPMKNLNTAKPTYQALQDLAGDIRTLGKEQPVGISKGEVGSLTGHGTEYLTDPQTGEVMAQFRDGNLVTAGNNAPVSAESASAKTLATPSNVTTGTFQGVQDIKKFIADQVEKAGGYRALNPTEKNLALRQAYSMVKDKLEDSAGAAARASGDDKLLKNYLEAKAGYRNSGDVAKIAQDQALRQNANRFFSPSDYLSGAGGAIIGAMSGGDTVGEKMQHAAIGAGLGLANKTARTYGVPLVSAALDKGGALVRNSLPIKAAQELVPALNAAGRSPLALAGAQAGMNGPQTGNSSDRWASQGVQKLGIQDQDLRARLLQDPKGKQLLIQASDLSPGSKAMKNLMNQIQKGWGSK